MKRGVADPGRRADRRSFSETASVVKPPLFVLASSSFVLVLCGRNVEVSQLHRIAPAVEQAPHPSAGPAQAAVDAASGQTSPQRFRRIPFRLRVWCILRCCLFSTFLTGYSTVAFACVCPARSVHPSLRAPSGDLMYAGA